MTSLLYLNYYLARHSLIKSTYPTLYMMVPLELEPAGRTRSRLKSRIGRIFFSLSLNVASLFTVMSVFSKNCKSYVQEIMAFSSVLVTTWSATNTDAWIW